MNKVSFVFVVLLIGGLTACDSTEHFNKPRTEQRSMVIGGMPAFDQDYKITETAQTEK
jgi:hypothetical protein